MNIDFDIDDIQFCDNTAKEAEEAKAQVQEIIAAMQARIEAAEKIAERLRSIRALAEEADARGEDVPPNGFFTVADAAALEAWEALK